MSAKTIVYLDHITINEIIQQESAESIYKHFTLRLEQRQLSWDKSHRDEWSLGLYNKLFCAAVQFGHAELAEKIAQDENFHQWITNKRHGENMFHTTMQEVISIITFIKLIN